MKTIYIAHSITNEINNLIYINALISWLKKQKYKIIQPNYSLFPEKLATETIKNIGHVNIVIADVSVYSHGVGFEIGYAYALKKNIILIANISSKDRVSNFLFGLFPDIKYYKNEYELIEMISNDLNELIKKKPQRKDSV